MEKQTALGLLVVVTIITIIATLFIWLPPNLISIAREDTTYAMFSPDGGCRDEIIYWVGKANKTIHIMIYSFTTEEISDALIEAHNNGIEVKLIMETSQITKYSEYGVLVADGIPVLNRTGSGIMHNKVMIIDDTVVITGSYNWSENAEKYNDENIVVLFESRIINLFEQKFNEMWIREST